MQLLESAGVIKEDQRLNSDSFVNLQHENYENNHETGKRKDFGE